MKKASSPQAGSATDNLVAEAATFIGIDDFRPHLEMASIAVENRIPSPYTPPMSATAPVLTERSFLYDRNGEPQAVILPWKVYTEVAETFGWDLSEAEEADLRQAMRDSNEGNQDAFISMEDLE